MKNNDLYEQIKNMPTMRQIIIENKYFKPKKEEDKIKFQLYKPSSKDAK